MDGFQLLSRVSYKGRWGAKSQISSSPSAQPHQHHSMILAAVGLYEHPDFVDPSGYDWKQWRSKISTRAHCVAVSAVVLVIAASTFGIYKVSTVASLKSALYWQGRFVSVLEASLNLSLTDTVLLSPIH
jgi:hypothetical protein